MHDEVVQFVDGGGFKLALLELGREPVRAPPRTDKNCPNFRGKVGKRVHIGFPDPAKATGTDEEKLKVFRNVRDDIQKRFREYYDTEISKKL